MAPQNEAVTATQVAKIAAYDDLLSAPRVVEIPPSDVATYIDQIASTTYEMATSLGGIIPYTVIREVSENFIHAQFKEVTVSILDHGCTIRFADQGPGIENKDRAQLPGFSSATNEMKSYIRGVGSGLPIVKEYLKFSNGRLVIEDNIKDGAVVTIAVDRETAGQAPVVWQESPSAATFGAQQQGGYVQRQTQMQQASDSMGAQYLQQSQPAMQAGFQPMQQQAQMPAQSGLGTQQATRGFQQPTQQMGIPANNMGYQSQAATTPAYPSMQPAAPMSMLDEQEANILILATEGAVGPTEVANALGMATTTAFRKLAGLEKSGFLMGDPAHKGKRILTQLGQQILREQV